MKQWTAKWIGIPGRCMVDCRRRTLPAPEFRRCFVPERDIDEAVLFVSGLGYFECKINGRPVSQDLLVPSPTQYDKRWRYMRYKLDFPLKQGQKYLFSVTLGNGLYNCQAKDMIWHFYMANWRDYPKMILQLEDGAGKVLLASDTKWVTAFSATQYDSFRGGEIYDARKELPFSLDEPEADYISHIHTEGWPADFEMGENAWHHVWIAAPPGGIGVEQDFAGCRIQQRIAMKETAPGLWASPINAAALPEISVSGEAGAQVTITCGERLSQDGKSVDNTIIGALTPSDDPFQRDTYILKGEGVEIWHPRFTYHGFQYAQVVCTGNVQVRGIEQLVVYTDFAKRGGIETSDERLKKIEECAMRACNSNFCGYPTDCPHREKNGWTSEAMLMCRTMLFNYDAERAYSAFVDTMCDAQRPSGQLPGMVPSAGWGYNWGGGGHWDFALFDIPYSLWQFTGDINYLKRFYGAMHQNLYFQRAVSDEDGLCYALGDWLQPAPREYLVGCGATAFHIAAVQRTKQVAKALGRDDDYAALEAEEKELKESYNKRFYLGDGVYKGTHTTYFAMPLNLGIVPEADRAKCVAHLRKMLSEKGFKVDYGT
ncbi:MAG: family 78 glycoside hydrolase catalytic domain, partial [Victivallales bacterium]|nr:family 78 glycoside hydrolase catalytic domain [Victivallales bacterium]